MSTKNKLISKKEITNLFPELTHEDLIAFEDYYKIISPDDSNEKAYPLKDLETFILSKNLQKLQMLVSIKASEYAQSLKAKSIIIPDIVGEILNDMKSYYKNHPKEHLSFKSNIKQYFISEQYRNFFTEKDISAQTLLLKEEAISNFLSENFRRKKSINVNSRLDFFCVFIGFKGWIDAVSSRFALPTTLENISYNKIAEKMNLSIEMLDSLDQKIDNLTSNQDLNHDTLLKESSTIFSELRKQSKNIASIKSFLNTTNNYSNDFSEKIQAIEQRLIETTFSITNFQNGIEYSTNRIIENQNKNTNQLKRYSFAIGTLVVIVGTIIIITSKINLFPKKDSTPKFDKKALLASIKIQLPYNEIRNFNHGLARVRKDTTYGFINNKGDLLFSLICDSVSDFSNRFAIVKKNNLFAFINEKGELITDFKYTKANHFSNGLAKVKENGLYKFINIQGKDSIILGNKYDFISDFNEGIAIVKKENKYGFINSLGTEIKLFKSSYDNVELFHNNLAIVKKNNQYGIINTFEETIIPTVYRFIKRHYDGTYKTKKSKGCMYLNKNGIPITSPKDIAEWTGFSDGVIKVRDSKSKKFKFINYEGEVIIPSIADEASSFSQGLAWIKRNKDSLHYLIDKMQRIILKVNYDRVFEFNNNIAPVYQNGKYGFINLKGELITPLNFDNIIIDSSFKNGYNPVKKRGKWGLIDKKGVLIIPYKYDYLTPKNNTFFEATLGDRTFIINQDDIVIADKLKI